MFCCHPIFFKNTLLPCGKCVNCRKRRINDWKVKVMLENLFFHNYSLFCTFTYDDDHLPKDSVLDYSDFQKFIKRLRKKFDNIRYFCCEEYGSKFGRPHFHAIIFNIPYSFTNIEIINKCWKNGFTCIKPLKPQNIGYVAKYCVKQFQKTKKFLVNDKEVERCEKIHWSAGRVGGLGWRYFRENLDLFLYSSTIKVNGYTYSIPRSFLQKLSKERLLSKIRCVFSKEKKKINVLSNNYDFSHICDALNLLSKFKFSLPDFDFRHFHDKKEVYSFISSSILSFLLDKKFDFSFSSSDSDFVFSIYCFIFDFLKQYDDRFDIFIQISYYHCNYFYKYISNSIDYIFSHYIFNYVNYYNFTLLLDKNRTKAIDYCIKHHIDFYDYEKQYVSNDNFYYYKLLVDTQFILF